METGSIALTSEEIADKIFDLTEQFHRYAFAHPDLLDEIPDKAILVFLDEADPAFNRENIKLANRRRTSDTGDLVFVNMRREAQTVDEVNWRAEIVT